MHPSKYHSLLDATIWEFIETSNSYFPPDAVDLTTEQQREYYNKMCRAMVSEENRSIRRRDFSVNSGQLMLREYLPQSVEAEAPTPTKATVLYFHGGGFVVGDLDSHDDVCAEICRKTQFRVIACDYRLAPEHKHPAPFEDAMTAYGYVSELNPEKIILVGDSAGASLAASVASKARTLDRQPDGQVLIYPYLGGPMDSGSAIEHANAPLLSTADMDYYHQIRIDPNAAVPSDDSFAPLWATDFSGLPSTAVYSAQCDPLCDDGVLYAERINADGGDASCIIEPGLVHGYLRARHSAPVARASVDRILNSISAFGA